MKALILLFAVALFLTGCHRMVYVDGGVAGSSYAEMYMYNPVGSPLTFNVDFADTYYNLTNLTVSEIVGFTFTDANQTNGGSYLTALESGVYEITFVMSFASEANGGLYGFSASHNHDPMLHRECYSRRSARTDVGSVTVACKVDADAGDNFSVMIENENNDRDIHIHTTSYDIVRIA